MAQVLKLDSMDEADDGVTRETKLRVWWSCFIIDTWSSGGSSVARQLRIPEKRPRVPMDESAFYRMRSGDPDIGAEDWRPGIWGHMVIMVNIYRQIQDLLHYLAETTEWDDEAVGKEVHRLDTELDAFERNLPPEMRWSLENLALHITKGLGRVFVAFHIGFHHYYTLLFYQHLDQRRLPTRSSRAYAARCKHHSTIVCDVLKASREHREAEALYHIVGHVTVVSSSVLLHTYLFGDAAELPDTSGRLKSNLESLVQLRRYWPGMELMVRVSAVQKDFVYFTIC